MQQKILELALERLLESHLPMPDESQDIKTCLFHPGEQYFIRTVTYHAAGRCKCVVAGFVVLTDVMWVADSGRLSDALKDGFEKQSQSELELIPNPLFVNINSIVDFTVYSPKIILLQK